VPKGHGKLLLGSLVDGHAQLGGHAEQLVAPGPL